MVIGRMTTPGNQVAAAIAFPDPALLAAVAERRRWYAVNTHPAAEAKACFNLKRQGWETFYPKTLKTIKSGRRIRSELRPFFPGYVFVSLDPYLDGWRAVDSTLGVRSIVKNGDSPSAVPRGIVEGLKQMTEEDGRIVSTSHLKTGENVRFLSGPFADMVGALERLDATGRVLVLLDILGRVTQVQAKAADLAPVR